MGSGRGREEEENDIYIYKFVHTYEVFQNTFLFLPFSSQATSSCDSSLLNFDSCTSQRVSLTFLNNKKKSEREGVCTVSLHWGCSKKYEIKTVQVLTNLNKSRCV